MRIFASFVGYLKVLVLGLILSCVAARGAEAKVSVSELFSNGVVLQRNQEIPIWGFASPGEAITVQLGNKKPIATTTDPHGHWKVKLESVVSGGPFELVISSVTNKLVVHDVLVGEVWLCAGQSNMLFPLWMAQDGKEAIGSAKSHDVRWFQVKKQFARKPQLHTEGKWLSCDSPNIAPMTAVGYFYAKELNEKLHVPIGIIDCSIGGTPIDTWISKRALMGLHEYPSILETWETLVQNEAMAQKYRTTIFDPAHPEQTVDPGISTADLTLSVPHVGSPTALFNGMIAPIIPYGLRGFVWYQGEADIFNLGAYRALFATLIDDWTTRFSPSSSNLNFLFVQLPNFGGFNTESWCGMRDAQKSALEMPHTSMAVTYDLGSETEIHPKRKREVAHRLALQALANVYGQAIEGSGPVYEAMTGDGREIRLRFSHADGLHATSGDGKLKGFEIAGFNGKFFPADGKIDGAEVELSNPLVKKPAEVRYGWGQMTDCNLYNSAELPASPFRIIVPPKIGSY